MPNDAPSAEPSESPSGSASSSPSESPHTSSTRHCVGELLVALRVVIDEIGLTAAARELNVPRHTLAAAAGGARVREGTRLLLADRLRRRVEGK